MSNMETRILRSTLLFPPQSDAPRMIPDVIEEGVIIVAAVAQLIAAVRPPPVGMIGQAFQVHELFIFAVHDTKQFLLLVSCLFLFTRCNTTSRPGDLA